MSDDEGAYWAQMQAEAEAHEAEQAAAREAEYYAAMEEEQSKMTEQSDAEKAALEHLARHKELSIEYSDGAHIGIFLAGAAWAAPKWIKCSEEPPPDEEVLVVWSGTVCTGWYTPENGHLPACWDISGRNLPVDVTEVTRWMLKPAAPEVEK